MPIAPPPLGLEVAALFAGAPPPAVVALWTAACALVGGLLLPSVVMRLCAGASLPRRRRLAAALGPTLALVGCSAVVVHPDQTWAGLALGAALTALATVDILTLRLPDALTLPLVGLGVVQGVAGGAEPGAEAATRMAGALGGYLALAAVEWGYRRLRGRSGLGLGDAKLFAAGGAWLGWLPLPSVLLSAAGLGLAWAAARLLSRGRAALTQPIPFGPPLCCAIWLIWLFAQR